MKANMWIVWTVVLTSLGGIVEWNYPSSPAGYILWGLALLCGILLTIEAANERWRVLTEYITALSQISGELWPHLKAPLVNYVQREYSGDLWEGVVPFEYFEYFLRTSKPDFISPERDWHSKDYPHGVWLTIYNKLNEFKYVRPGTAAGSHSQRWAPGAWDELWRKYMPHELKELVPDRPELHQYQASTHSPTETRSIRG
jgi:hypothetical protein